ncbi:MAG: flagellin [Planctomycetota bacterium]|nr:flagellin [Planctomycetota bacterium]
MTRINTNVPSVIAQNNLNRTSKELNLRLERLSTGMRINRGADDPAGLIISERLRTDINGVTTGIKNSDRASSIIATTEASLAEVSDLLNSVKALIVESANLSSQSERDANQLQIDSAIESITRISNTASFGGLKLLNGSLDYLLSSVAGSAITKVQVRNASFVDVDDLQVQVDVVASAQRGELFFRGDTPTAGQIPSATTLQITGNTGVEVISLPVSATISDIIEAVNKVTLLTGVTASPTTISSINGIVFRSKDFGSDSFVSVKRLGGPADPSGDYFRGRLMKNPTGYEVPSTPTWTSMSVADRDEGRDVEALVNGNLATGRGLNVSVNSSSLSLELLLTSAAAVRPAATGTAFFITGGGALFQLGPEVNSLQQANVGIPSVAASNLGGTVVDGTLQFLSSLRSGETNSVASSARRSDFSQASQILERAIDEVSVLRGRMGAFERNVLETNVRSLQAAFENLTASESQIRDADFAAETSQLTRAQILSNSGTSILTLANQQSQQVLQLLG